MMISIFSLLSFIAICIILTIQYNFNQNVTTKIANDQFDILSQNINKDLNHLDKTYENFVSIYTSFLKDGNIQNILEDKRQLIKIYTDFLKRNKNIYALYVGTGEDLFFNLRKIGKSRALHGYKANGVDVWLTREIYKGMETRVHYDKNLQETFSKKIQASYKATQRPWYKEAVSSGGKTIRTDPYKFDLFNEYGITYSKEYAKGDVFSMDILLEDMDDMLESRLILESQRSCIVDGNFTIIAKTKLLDVAIGEKILSLYKEGFKQGTKNINGAKYIYQVERFGKDFLISYANFDTLMMPYQKELEKNFIFALIIVFILSLLVWVLASSIMKPIHALSRENEKIALRDFDNIEQVDSCVLEISELSSSLVKMAQTIKKHHKELEYLSSTDTLTKMYNRAKLEAVLQVKKEDFARYGYKFGIIMIDVDHFKVINDKFGHQVGDKFLVEFANILKNSMRSGDIVGRWGGEEFIVVCKEGDTQSLEKLANKLKQSIQSYNFENVENKTASFGIAQYEKGESIAKLINRADKALYRAKDGGRNKIMMG